MKRLIALLLFPFLIYGAPWVIVGKPGYYYLTDKIMREIFNMGGFTARITASYAFRKPLLLWNDVGYFQKNGTAIGGNEKVKILLASWTIGLKGAYYFHPQLALYAGAGPRLFFLRLTNNSPFVKKHQDRYGVGGGVIGGLWLFPFESKGFLIDLFLDYSFKKFNFGPNSKASVVFDTSIDGLNAGVGLGYRF